ncbi:NAD(P)H-dependent oxidoreductase subunit E [Zavarzinella formosa]|uniref:NAD(P)H-dependent oxidoreductase subunit E n=1 Tax=Zavarzinella formosa TaxID=360055 RepID=UPI00031E55CF|nr:NAD(P)H-dependent oxidoreductase subunit E [Zavarzinella formosa]
MIVPGLNKIQERFGFLPDAELHRLAGELGVPLYRIQEVVSFYPHYRNEWNPPPTLEVKVCRDMACHLAGAPVLTDKLRRELKNVAAMTSTTVTVDGVSCLGRCDRAPACIVSKHDPKHAHKEEEHHERVYAGLPLKTLVSELSQILAGLPTVTPDETLSRVYGDDYSLPDLTPDVSYHPCDPNKASPKDWLIDVYGRNPELLRYAATRKFLDKHPLPVPRPTVEGTSEKAIQERHPFLWELKLSNLLGMGGAGTPAFNKWRDVWIAAGDEKYVVVNGDESEPGTFKDRELLVKMPHLVVEGVLLGVLLTGASAGFVFIRHEYHEQIEAVQKEIETAKTELNKTFQLINRPFPRLEVFTSPGGYVLGEQSALIEAMESKRGQPRNKPPELQTNGLFDKPTLLNNVETFAWVPSIMLNGGQWYAGFGQNGGKGRRLFSVCGDLQHPGVFEVEIGEPLGKLIELAGGMRPGRTLKAIATSGPSAGFMPARLPVRPGVADRLKKAVTGKNPAMDQMATAFATEHLMKDGQDAPFVDIGAWPLDLNFFRGPAAGLIGVRIEPMLGAGLVVYDDTRDMLAEARNCNEFFRNESCGKCVPCRIGTQKLVEIGTDLLRRRDKTPAGETAMPPVFVEQLNSHFGELCTTIKNTSICALGPSAAAPLTSVMNFFPQDLAANREQRNA